MINFLDYVYEQFLTKGDIGINYAKDIRYYQWCWEKWGDDMTTSPTYAGNSSYFHEQKFTLLTGETIDIIWNVSVLNEIAAKHSQIQYFSFDELTYILQDNLTASAEALRKADKIVQSVIEHTYKPLLIMRFQTFDDLLLIDGKHRYTEYKKFNRDIPIPTYFLTDNMCISGIQHNNQLLAYIILHNVGVINEHIMGNNVRSLIPIKDYFDLDA